MDASVVCQKRPSATARGSRGAVPRSRYIPAEVKRAVWKRDGGQCAFVSPTGRRCPERGFLEFHHVVPYAAGGEPTVDSIALRCPAHSGYEAELYCLGREAVNHIRNSVRTE